MKHFLDNSVLVALYVEEQHTQKMKSFLQKHGETSHISRYINHSRKHPNLVPRLKTGGPGNIPRIIFKAKVNVEPGVELLFDYGDTRRDVVDANPWLLE